MKLSLETQFRQLKNLAPSEAFRENARRRLFQKIENRGNIWIICLLKNIFKPVPQLDYIKHAKVRIIEHIELTYEDQIKSRNIFGNLLYIFIGYKKTVSLILSSLLVFLLITTPYSEVSARSELVVSKGTVEIKSLGEDWKVVKNKHRIKIGDAIKTFDNAYAQIYFSDNSVARLSENTYVSISLFSDDNKNLISEKTETVIKLQEGRLWTNVLPKTSDQLFSVETKDSRISAVHGVFDIEANGITKVRAIQNSVSVEPRNSLSPILLSAGFQTKVSETNPEISIVSNIKKDQWSKENQTQDTEFQKVAIEKAKEQMKEIAGILPTNLLYEVKEVVKSIQSKSVDSIIQEFNESKVLMSLNEIELATIKFEEASSDLSLIWSSKENQEQNQKEIISYLEKEKALFTQILPGDSLFPIKKQFEGLFILYANNPENEKIDIVANKLIEAQNLALKQEVLNTTLIASLEGFSIGNKSIFENTINTNEKIKLEQLLSMQNKELQQLQAISKNVQDEEVLKTTDAIKQDLVNSIQEIVSKIAPQEVPQKTVNKNQARWFAKQINLMVEKVEMYKSERGRTNTIYWILQNIEDDPKNIGLLYSLKDAMPQDVKIPISKKILKIKKGK